VARPPSTAPWAVLMLPEMKECLQCRDVFPDTYVYCPSDGEKLGESDAPAEDLPSVKATPVAETVIRLRTLVGAVAVLFLAGIICFAGVFLYQYFRPRYGGLLIKTTPAGASISVDGKQRGVSPISISNLRAGGHQIKARKEGYKDLVQQIEVFPYYEDNLYLTLEATRHQLTNEQLAEIESLRRKLDTAQQEKILLPPPEDYNVLFFADRILAIDPANAHALEVKSNLADSIRREADLAYAREDWLDAEAHYKSLALIFPDDITINERLGDLATKIDASLKDRDQQVAEWTAKAEAALASGNLIPPDKDNAVEALRNILRLDRRNAFARNGMLRVREKLQNRGDVRIGNGDWQGARNDFKQVLQLFPEDEYSKERLALTETKLSELAQLEIQRIQRMQEEQQSRQLVANLRQSALAAFRSGAFDRSLSEWEEFLKFDPNSDEAYYHIGAIYNEKKQYDTAILNYEKCLSLNPSYARAHVEIGILYDRHRNSSALAIEHLRKAKELGGFEGYTTDRLQSMIAGLQEQVQLGNLEKMPFAVEHKHAFSSCRGILRISEAGVEFKTGETDHSFFEPFVRLRSLSVDEDEVSIRTSNNKKYNFRLLNAGDGMKVRRLAARYGHVSN